MAEPLTTGALVAAALAMGAEAAYKGVIGAAAKDAWEALKRRLSGWAEPADVQALEARPASKARRDVIAEAIEERPASEKDEAADLARRLIAALREQGPQSIGLDVEAVEAVYVRLGALDVSGGTGARIGKVKAHTFETGDITVRGPAGKR